MPMQDMGFQRLHHDLRIVKHRLTSTVPGTGVRCGGAQIHMLFACP
jgi:hypothetical protein